MEDPPVSAAIRTQPDQGHAGIDLVASALQVCDHGNRVRPVRRFAKDHPIRGYDCIGADDNSVCSGLYGLFCRQGGNLLCLMAGQFLHHAGRVRGDSLLLTSGRYHFESKSRLFQ